MSISNSKPFLNLSILSLYFLILSNHPLLTASLPIEINHKYGIATTNVSSPPPNPPTTGSGAAPFRPGIAATLGVLAIIISIAIILLLYAQHCNGIYANYIINSRSIPLSRENSGVDTKVIQKLPLFRFASLKGQKDGLECAVCLTNFDSDEVLRLLPKCKHAFHVECVDTWLLTHSTCPLCRYRVDPEDMPHESYKSLYNYKDTNDDSNERGKALEIIVENPDQDFDPERASSGVSTSGQRRDDLGRDSGSKSLDGKVQGRKHRVEHRIIVSSGGEEVEGEGRRRWSDVEAADFLYLRSEMIMEGGGSGRRVISRRSLSERIGMSRHRNNNGEGNGERSREEEGVGKRWLAWISRSQQKTVDVPPPNSASSPVIV